jgi:hypothetical protein
MKILSMLRESLALPNAVELGRSDHSYLPSSDFTPFQEDMKYTWEDWHAEVQRRFPVRYFLNETLPDWFHPLRRGTRDAAYWLKCHMLRSHRFHLLDLRGVDPFGPYTHGYMDPCEVMRISAWKALRDYVEKEHPRDPSAGITGEDPELDAILQENKDRYDEVMALHDWWMRGRGVERDEETRLFDLVQEAKRLKDQALYEERVKPWLNSHRAQEDREEEMFLRLTRLRPYLWT